MTYPNQADLARFQQATAAVTARIGARPVQGMSLPCGASHVLTDEQLRQRMAVRNNIFIGQQSFDRAVRDELHAMVVRHYAAEAAKLDRLAA